MNWFASEWKEFLVAQKNGTSEDGVELPVVAQCNTTQTRPPLALHINYAFGLISARQNAIWIGALCDRAERQRGNLFDGSPFCRS